jgi:hypothetical protein
MNSFTVRSYWDSYNELSQDVKKQADTKFEFWKDDPFHPSLHFKCVNSEDNIWSVRNVAVIAFTRRRIDLGQICSI